MCDGNFAGMDGISNWNYQTPRCSDAEACLKRCQGRSECKFIKFDTRNGNCKALSHIEGRCYTNDHDKIYKALPSTEKKAEAKKETTTGGPKAICNGGFAGMDNVGNWNTQSPRSDDAAACLKRCAGRSDCKFIKYNYKNKNCYALKNHVGQCYPNDHEKIYAM